MQPLREHHHPRINFFHIIVLFLEIRGFCGSGLWLLYIALWLLTALCSRILGLLGFGL
jgi:hypothetical protein